MRCMACMHTQPLRRLVYQRLPRSLTLRYKCLHALIAQPTRKHTLRLRASLNTPSNNSPRNKKRPAELQTYRGYLGDTRSKKSRYSNAAIDRVKEDHRENMRTVFDFERWAIHRSSQRYIQHIIGIPKSRIIEGLKAPLISMFFFSLSVASWEAWKEAHPPAFPEASLEPIDPFNLTSFALALLLAFRLDASYNRYMRGRELWGTVVCDSRDLVRKAQAYVDDDAAMQQLMRWTITFPKVLMWHVRESCDLCAELQDVLLPSELEQVLRHAQHRPNFVLAILSRLVAKLPGVPEHQRAGLDATLTNFSRAVSSCERTIKTPIPRSYTRHTSRFLVIWLGFLPFTLWRACHWVMVPAAVLIAFLLLGVEEIGVQIEEPFGILPLENLVDTVQANLVEMVTSQSIVRQLADDPDSLESDNQASTNGSIATETVPMEGRQKLRTL